jgi:hypothetical protein
MQERLQRAGSCSVDGVEAVHRLVQLEAPCHLSAPAGQVGDLPRADAGGQMRQEATVPLRGFDPHEAERQRLRPLADLPIGIHDSAIKAQGLLRAAQRGRPLARAPG